MCFELRKLIHDDEPVWRDPYPGALARSVQALAHESVHASGDVNEARAECSGLQKIVEAAVELGRTPKEGRYLARLYWRAWYPRHAVPYRSTECRDGGRLDFSPETRAWP